MDVSSAGGFTRAKKPTGACIARRAGHTYLDKLSERDCIFPWYGEPSPAHTKLRVLSIVVVPAFEILGIIFNNALGTRVGVSEPSRMANCTPA